MEYEDASGIFIFMLVSRRAAGDFIFRTSPGWERKGTREYQAQNGLRLPLLTGDYALPRETVYTRMENSD